MALLAPILAVGCATSAAEDTPREGPPPALVATAPGRPGPLRVDHAYLGEVRSLARAWLAAGAAGEVRDVRVREGDAVRAGDVLLVVDPDAARARLGAAAATRARVAEEAAQAARDAARFEGAGTDAVAETEIERAASVAERLRAEEEARRAAEAEARELLSRHRVVAPFDGVVADRAVDPGAWVSEGTRAVELVASTGVEVLVAVPPEVSRRLTVGDAVALRGLAGDRGEGAVSGIVPAVDPATRTVTVRVVPAPDTGDWLLPGATVDAVLTVTHDAAGALVVPRDAVVRGAVETRVVRVVDGEAEVVPVEVVAGGATDVLVRGEGLAPSDAFVVRGNERLRPGQAVRVAERDPGEGERG